MSLKNHIPLMLLMFVMLFAGFKTYKDYGVAWDEDMQREMGRFNYNYITGQNDSLLNWRCRDYGVVVELPLYVLEKNLTPNKPAQTSFMRHLACFIFYCVGIVFFYFILLKLRFNAVWAFSGVLMLVVSPRIYGHAFINSKDIPLMIFYIIAFYTLLSFIEKPSFKRSIFHAFACALLIDTRVSGFIIIPATILFHLLWEYQKSDKKLTEIIKSDSLKNLKYFLAFSAVFIYILWPYLWLNPIKNFLVAFLNMSQFRWKGTTLLFGEFINAAHTPWYFGITWLGITTPLLYLILFIVGLFFFFHQIKKTSESVFRSKAFVEMLMPLCLFIGPIAATVLLKSVLYDTWRHLYFVYPFLVIIALYGAKLIYQKMSNNITKWAAIAFFFAYINIGLLQMIRAFPHEYVFFNELISSNSGYIRKNFEMDYWGISFRKGLEKILENDSHDTIKITGNVYPYYGNFLLLTQLDKNCRLKYVIKESEADYYLTNYRYSPNDHTHLKNKEFYKIMYKNSEILGVYYLK